jgi:hypothetical protein
MVISRPACALGTSTLLSASSPSAWLDEAERLGVASLYLAAGLGLGENLTAAPSLLVAHRPGLPVVALDAVLGAYRSESVGQDARTALAQAASLDRAEAEQAVAVTQAALLFAEELGARYVVLGLGAARRLARLWQALRGRFLRGVLLYDEDSAREFMRIRAALAPRYLDAARRSLDRIVEEGARRGITVLLRNPRRPTDLPTGLELSALRAEFQGAPLAPLLDLPAAHLTSTLRCIPLRETVLAFGDGPLASLGDACGAVGGLLPGQGEVDVAAVARALPKEASRAFVPWPGLTPDEVVAGYRAVAAL